MSSGEKLAFFFEFLSKVHQQHRQFWHLLVDLKDYQYFKTADNFQGLTTADMI
jgi:hypothetical protein